MKKKKEIEVHLEIKYVPLPPEKEAAWWDGIGIIVEMVQAIALKQKQEAGKDSEYAHRH